MQYVEEGDGGDVLGHPEKKVEIVDHKIGIQKLNKKHKDYCFKLYLYNGLKTGKV